MYATLKKKYRDKTMLHIKTNAFNLAPHKLSGVSRVEYVAASPSWIFPRLLL